MDTETILYAQSRADETKRRYLISDVGHVLVDCAANRKALREMGAKVVAELRPGGNGCTDSVGHPLTCKCPYGPGVP
jgi:hypothetical protein